MMPCPDENRKQKNPRFVCDAMLGGLARWLRAAGYSAEFDVHCTDGGIVRKALREEKILLTSDGGIPERYAVSEGMVRCLFVPRGLSLTEQLGHVLRHFGLPLRQARCMECNATLRLASLEEVAGRLPQKVRQHYEQFFLCEGCRKVFWQGTHWESISRRLSRAQRIATTPQNPP